MSSPPLDDYTASQVERMPVRVFPHAHDACRSVAEQIAACIRQKASEGKPCVLGLATGSTPIGVYAELVRLHQEAGLSFANVVTFNLDEYYPMQPEELQSYIRFMREHLFDLVDIKAENIHIPDGTLPIEQVADYCKWYEAEIKRAGGIDIQLLGIGRSGHIGFNEPGSGKGSRTRLITLDGFTRTDAASDFFGQENVPRRALTMGVGTILEARQVFLLAFSENKAPIVQGAAEGEVRASITASFLQEHDCVEMILDEAAASELTRCKSPWLLGPIDWDEDLVRKAVIWLAMQVKKPILKLTDADYNEEGLQDLLADRGPAYDINLTVFRHLQSTIIGWPGGKPANIRQPGDRPQALGDIFPKRIIIFSPHPDDDVISMGGTFIRLLDQGHEVHVAYQTSGNIAVFDDDAIRYAEFAADFNREFGIGAERTTELEKHIEQHLKHKEAGQVDSPEVQHIKAMIRRGEARAGCRCCGLEEKEQIHFMDMPFYETGRVKKAPLSDKDIHITVDLLRKIRPQQIYAAGDLSDPHGTHRTCLNAVLQAYEVCKDDDWRQQSEVWLYRGAWHEWGPHEIEMAVPLSPDEVDRKRIAIFKHESQKDRALFPGSDVREFWKRAEDRNRETAELYDQLGLAEYEAMEGFVRWSPEKQLL
ncbi:MAG: glucosamine-6-phosphate deaminase [Planctomycetes bacterium]|nr:glucosamine-6-phosphate deaminase [Planctomycetota bacterium]